MRTFDGSYLMAMAYAGTVVNVVTAVAAEAEGTGQ